MEVEESLNEQMCRTAVEKMYLNYLNNSLLEGVAQVQSALPFGLLIQKIKYNPGLQI